MSTRILLVLLAVLPFGVVAQVSTAPPQAEPAHAASPTFNAPTLAVLRANRPADLDEAQWLKRMEEPVNRSLYPLHVTQAMRDTLDTKGLDLRFQYVMVQ
jgi:hypothetical protein